MKNGRTSGVIQRLLGALLFSLALTPASRAAPDSDLAAAPLDALLDMEVSGASKFTLRMSDAASSVSVITAEQMRALGVRTLADALRTMRGLSLSSDRTYNYIGVRGLAAELKALGL